MTKRDRPRLRFKRGSNPWMKYRLSQLIHLIAGNPFPSSSATRQGIPWLKITNVRAGYIDWKAIAHLPQSFWRKFRQFRLAPGDFVMALTRPIVNHRIKVAQIASHDALLNQRVAKIEFQQDPIFLFQLLQTPKMVQQIENVIDGSDPPNLGMKSLTLIDTYAPGIAEQHQIGELLASTDDMITSNCQEIQQLVLLKQVLIQRVYHQEWRFNGFRRKWQEKFLYEVADYRNGKAHEQAIVPDGKYIVINSKFVASDETIMKYSNDQIAPLFVGDVAFVLSDVPNGKALAKTFLVDQDDHYTLNQRVAALTLKNHGDPVFLQELLNRNPYFLKFDDRVGQTNLSRKDVTSFLSRYPAPEEQKMIGILIRSLEEVITIEKQRAEQLQTLKEYLMSNLFI